MTLASLGPFGIVYDGRDQRVFPRDVNYDFEYLRRRAKFEARRFEDLGNDEQMSLVGRSHFVKAPAWQYENMRRSTDS